MYVRDIDTVELIFFNAIMQITDSQKVDKNFKFAPEGVRYSPPGLGTPARVM
jgi:hypothetical protein